MRFVIVFVLNLFVLKVAVFAQDGRSKVISLINKVDEISKRTARERVYLHLDRPYYAPGDTIWIKGYVLDDSLNYSKQSGLLYVELINNEDKLVTRKVFPVRDGISFGELGIDTSLKAGSYELRAYTNWMQNQGEESFYHTNFQLIDNRINWIINKNSKLDIADNTVNLQVLLKFKNAGNDYPVRLEPLKAILLNGNSMVSQGNLQTDLDGKVKLTYHFAGSSGQKLSVKIKTLRKNGIQDEFIVPIADSLNDNNTDLNFFPEGGRMVAGMSSVIGFKAIGKDGKGKDVKGAIFNKLNKQVAIFSTAFKGMGHFKLTPEPNETYIAKVALPNGKELLYKLPEVSSSGVSFHIDATKKDSLTISLSATRDSMGNNASYQIIAENNGRVAYAAALNLNSERSTIKWAVDNQRFATGVVSFTVFDHDLHPVAQRKVFVNHQDELKLHLEQVSIKQQEHIYRLRVTDKEGQPVRGSFSLAITDDGLVRTDTTASNMRTYYELESNVNGFVESPEAYFSKNNPLASTSLDDLLLTQGWTNYNPAGSSFSDPLFAPESEFKVSGTVLRLDKPQQGLLVTLLSTKKPLIIKDTVSDKNGRFIFSGFPKLDSTAFFIEVKDNKGAIFPAEIKVDEFKPPKISFVQKSEPSPWYIDPDTTALAFVLQENKHTEALWKLQNPAGARQLKEVVIKAKKMIKGSQFYAGAGASPDLVLGEEDIKKAEKKTLGEILAANVKGFVSEPFPCGHPITFEYAVFCEMLLLKIDGFAVNTFYPIRASGSYTDHYNFIKDYLDNITAEDIRGIEVKGAYVEVTTYSKNGAFTKRREGVELYRPLLVSWPKQFYVPKYMVSDTAWNNSRSLVYWDPNIITDEKGAATIAVGLKSIPSHYTLVLQGTDFNGHIGCWKIKLPQ
jgi:hypothetical protein